MKSSLIFIVALSLATLCLGTKRRLLIEQDLRQQGYRPAKVELKERKRGAPATPDVKPLVDSQEAFTFDMYRELSKQDQNLFFSPYSINTALSMVYEGAKGNAKKEIESVLHIDIVDQNRLDALCALDAQLMKKQNGCTINIANGIWVDKSTKLLRPYYSVVTKKYKAQAKNVDFKNAPEPNRTAINEWVEKATQKKITNLFEQGSIDSSTVVVLVNAIYFKGMWAQQFDKNLTFDEPFRGEDNSVTNVPMMRIIGSNAEFKYGATENLQLLEMPYKCGNLSMILMLPKKDPGLSSIESQLNKETLTTWLDAISKHEQRVDVYIPRFKVTSKYTLNDNLIHLGMSSAFGAGKADFSGIDGTRSLFISLVVHQAFVEVNEEGTEAAAATGIVMTKSAFIPRVPVFRADHPFIFVIRENTTGAILFMGKFVKPEVETNKKS